MHFAALVIIFSYMYTSLYIFYEVVQSCRFANIQLLCIIVMLIFIHYRINKLAKDSLEKKTVKVKHEQTNTDIGMLQQFWDCNSIFIFFAKI